MGGAHQLHEIGTRAEARVHLEKVLHTVAVEVVGFDALPEHRRNPERGDAEVRQISELALDAGDRPSLESPPAGLLPDVPPPLRKAIGLRVCRALSGDLAAVQPRSRVLLPVGKAIGEEEVSTSSRQSAGEGCIASRSGNCSRAASIIRGAGA